MSIIQQIKGIFNEDGFWIEVAWRLVLIAMYILIDGLINGWN